MLSLIASVASAQEGDARAEAGERFERGLALFDEGRYDAALAELEHAYRIAPAYAVLFNIAQVHARLGHAVQAVDAYERYLREGGDRIAVDRRREVEGELELQRARIAWLMVEANVEGANVTLDGDLVGRTPLSAPLRVSEGDRLVTVAAPGHEAEPRRVRLAGGVTETVRFELRETGSLRGTIAVVSRLRDVEIAIDGEVVGRTPLDATISVSPGLHEVRASRPGYVTETRQVEVDVGAEARVEADLEIDARATEDARGRVRITLPSAATVRVDGVAVATVTTLELPVGTHELELEAPRRRPLRETVVVRTGETTEVTPAFEWEPAVRRERIDAASAQRTAGAAIAILGGVLLAGGAGIVIGNEILASDSRLDERRVELERCQDRPMECDDTVISPGTPGGGRLEAYRDAVTRLNADTATYNTLAGVGWVMFGVGVGAIAVSLALIITAPSDDAIDEEARAEGPRLELRAGPTGLAFAGAF